MKSDTTFRHRMPQDVQKLLDSSLTLKEKWEALTPLARNEWICYVTIVKKVETRNEHLRRLKEDLLKERNDPVVGQAALTDDRPPANGLLDTWRVNNSFLYFLFVAYHARI